MLDVDRFMNEFRILKNFIGNAAAIIAITTLNNELNRRRGGRR